MEIGATLDHLQLLSPDPARCADFYARLYGFTVVSEGSSLICTAPRRRLVISPGEATQPGFAGYAFPTSEALAAYRQRIESQVTLHASPSPLFGVDALMVRDPDGNQLVFGVRATEPATPLGAMPVARLQHYAVRSTDPAKLRAFYRDALCFDVSDSVYDDERFIRAVFLRSDPEHHVLAVFHSPQRCHDHFSMETSDWTGLRDWADRITGLGAPIVWGVGRHGPGNDTFFMVRDPDGNLVEISAELEVCGPERVEHEWRHEERTLNLWGRAIMRS